jgi:hypothetical protein
MFTYEELSRVARKYYPREEGYCAVIAVSVAARVPFGKARSLLHKKGRKQGKGTNQVWTYSVLRDLGYKHNPWVSMHHPWPKTLATATRVLPKTGTFLLHTRGHISCVRDGVLEDWAADCKSRKRILMIQQVTETTKE